MSKQYTITPMLPSEAQIAIDWAKQEGWNPGLHDAQTFYRVNPTGLFIGKVEEEVVAVASSIIYDNNYAFFGLLIVKDGERGKGYGMGITDYRMAYVGDRNIGLDGVVEWQPAYAKNGFKYAHRNMRYHAVGFNHEDSLNDPHIQTLDKIPFKDIVTYDTAHYPAMRPAFVSTWINQPESLAIGYVKDGTLCGYAVIRPCYQGFKIGPLFADNETIAESLFGRLAHFAKDKDIYLEITELNPDAQNLVKRHNMNFVFETARMYTKEAPELPQKEIYSITNFEMG